MLSLKKLPWFHGIPNMDSSFFWLVYLHKNHQPTRGLNTAQFCRNRDEHLDLNTIKPWCTVDPSSSQWAIYQPVCRYVSSAQKAEMRTSMGSARKPVPNSSMAVFHAVRWESDMVEGLKKQHETSSLAEHLHQIHQIVYRILYIVNTSNSSNRL